ncbi:MAG: hypothetical protein A2176_13975 [Spirochaetes bacterium RBG_13_51_14]|nr:MAG: hypothetical protein A2176_13975 [Spirochaetes bacterium RBG_13_51_14]
MIAFTIRSRLDLLWNRKRLATLSEVIDIQTSGEAIKITLKGLSRVSMKKIIKYTYGEFEFINSQIIEPYDSLGDELRKKSQELIFLINVDESDKLIKLLNYIVDPAQMTDFISNYFIMDFRTRFRLYKEIDIRNRNQMLISELNILIHQMTKKRKK